jgi:hypothetical protein
MWSTCLRSGFAVAFDRQRHHHLYRTTGHDHLVNSTVTDNDPKPTVSDRRRSDPNLDGAAGLDDPVVSVVDIDHSQAPPAAAAASLENRETESLLAGQDIASSAVWLAARVSPIGSIAAPAAVAASVHEDYWPGVWLFLFPGRYEFWLT